MMRGKWIGVVGVCLLVLSGCAVTPNGSAPSPTPTAAPSTAAAEASTKAAKEAGVEASEVAVAALTAFVYHARSQDEWWADFSRYLSPEALYTWDGVRADRVTASAIAGDPVATVADATFVSVIIPTDAGSYRLEMAKRVDGSTAGTWLVFEMIAPETAE